MVTKAPAPSPAASTPAIAAAAIPGWIRARNIPEATKARVEHAQDGVANLLVDAQYLTRSDGHDRWFRWSRKVINRSGLESAGQIDVTYDPSFETVSINFIHLIRDGKVIDLTQETQFRVVEREEELDDGIISGTLKAMANLRDVRAGDVIDYALTTQSRSSLWPNHGFYHFSQRFSDPVAMRSLRLLWPAGMVPQYKAINSDIAFTTGKWAEGTEWEWIVSDPPAMQGEEDVPATAFQWGRLDISTMRDWAELAGWADRLYDGDESLPEDFAGRLDAIARTWPTPADRLTQATRLIQDNIRYVGEEMGEGSYVPRRPGTVATRGYGDCKDKSLLLAVALRRFGIDAVPALVSTEEGSTLPDRLPSPLAFDHVIVRAVIDGKVMWIDPTGSHRGGRGLAIVPANFGFALPIRAGQTQLERMEGFGARAGRVTVLEQFTVDEAAQAPLTLHVETHYTDARADSMRSRWAASSAKAVADANLEFYRERFPGLIESKSLELGDDRDGNVLTMVENYTMPRDAFIKAKISSKLVTRAYAMNEILPDRQSKPRIQPLALTDHIVNEQTIELHVKDRALDELDSVEAKVGSATFTRQISRLPDGLRMLYRLDTGERAVALSSEAEAVYAFSDKIKDEVGIEFYLEKSARNPDGSAPDGIDAATTAAIKPDLAKIVELIGKADEASRLEALSLIAAVSAKVEHPSPTAGLLDGLKGAVLTDLRRSRAALAALQSAVAQYDGNPGVFRLWIAHELDLGTGEAVASALERTRQVQPAVLAALDEQWVRLAFQKVQTLPSDKREKIRQDICITIANAGWQQKPSTDFGRSMLGCAVIAHSLRRELVEARAGLAQGLPTETLISLAIDRRHEALWSSIDRMGSDGFRRNLEREAAEAAVSANAAPKNYKTVTQQMSALRALGRYEDAVEAGRGLAGDTVQIEVAGRDGFWLVNEYALNLRALGRLDAAIAAMDGVLALGPDRYPDLVALEINRAGMVIAAGGYQAAIDSLTQTEVQRSGTLNAYGKMWVWANSACALRALGRVEEATVLEAKLAAKPEDNWNAVTSAAACRNDIKLIAEMLVKRLGDSEARTGALGLFIKFGATEAHSALEQSKLQAMANARALPEVQVEFAKYGRAIRYVGSTQGWSEF